MSLVAVTTSEQVEELPLQVFLWVTQTPGSISARDVQVFARMVDNTSWCQSRWARENLYHTRERHGSGWTPEALSRLPRDLEQLHAGLRSLRALLPAAECGLARTDLLRLAEATARASGGLLSQGGLRRERRDALLVLSALTEAILASPSETGPRATSGGPAASGPASGPRPATEGPRPKLRVRCSQVIDEAPEVRTFRFTATPPVRFSFAPGQFTTVEVRIGDETVRRSYTIASSPSRPDLLEITVKRVPGGRVSNWLHDHLRVGDELTLSGPAGKFSCELDARADKVLFIAGGSGITPVMSMARFLYDTADPRDVVFLYSARNEEDLIFRDELAFIAARSNHFRTIFTLTNPRPQWRGLRGRISLAMIEDAVPDFRQRSVYLCGPTPFMETVRAALGEGAFPMARFSAESFGGARAARPSPLTTAEAPRSLTPERGRSSAQLLGVLPRPRLGQNDAPAGPRPSNDPATSAAINEGSVVFSASGREARGCTLDTILTTAEAVGVPLPSACRSGVCGTCKTRKLSGNVVMDCEDGLDPGDRSAGFILACTAHPVDRVVLEA